MARGELFSAADPFHAEPGDHSGGGRHRRHPGGDESRLQPGVSRAHCALRADPGAWLTYYYAARTLGLAGLSTLYFVARIIVVVQAAVLLKERVTRGRWLAIAVGFAGVAIAAGPAYSGKHRARSARALCGDVLGNEHGAHARCQPHRHVRPARWSSSNAIFALACAAALPFLWVTPTWTALGLMLFLGVAGGLAQFALFESYRFAQASVIAPIEYTALVWAFVLGYVIWSDVPPPQVFLGAACIVGTCLVLVWSESRTLAGRAPRVNERPRRLLPRPAEICLPAQF